MPKEINWDEFFHKKEEKLALVHNESERFLEAKQRYDSPEEVFFQREASKHRGLSNNNRTVNLQNQYIGNSMTGPNPSKNYNLSREEEAMNQMRVMTSSDRMQADPFKFAKGTDFNGSQYGQFFERYYSHPTFKKNGFSPFRDNESFYNEHSTWGDDFKRMTKVWPKLAWDGYTGLFQNWGNFSLAGDTEHAANMEKYMSIAQSSKDGIGAKFTNFMGNSAYTFGILGEIATEEIGLALISLTGVGAPFGLTKSILNLTRAGKAIFDVGKYMKKIKTLKHMITNLQDVNEAKKFYTGLKTFGTGTLNFINPLEHSTAFIKGYGNIDDAAKMSRGFGSFYRDMRGINAAWDESTLEGGMVQNEISTKLLNEYYKEHGKLPEAGSEEANNIYNTADIAGRTTGMLNLPAILYSNKIVFDKALRGTRLDITDFGANLTRGIRKIGTKAGRDEAFVTFGKGFKDTFIQLGKKDYWKALPQSMLRSSGRYLSANLTEGFQEVYQEGLAVGAKDYYEAMYNNHMIGGDAFVKHSLYAGLQSQLSSQGLEVFLSGALMGSVVKGPQTLVFDIAPKALEYVGTSKIFDKTGTKRAELLARKAEQDKYAEQVAESMTAIHNNPNRLFDLVQQNALEQKNIAQLYEEAILNEDIKKAKDLSDTSMAFHLHTLVTNGKLNIFRNQIKSMSSLSDVELEQALNIEGNGSQATGIRGRVSKVLNQIDIFEQSYKKFNATFGQNKYTKDSVTYHAFVRAQRDFMYKGFALTQTIDRLEKLHATVSASNLTGVGMNNLNVLISNKTDFDNEIKLLGVQIIALNIPEATAEQKKQREGLVNKHRFITELKNNIDELVKTESEITAKTTNSTGGINLEIATLQDKYDKIKQGLPAQFKAYLNEVSTEKGILIDSDINNVLDNIIDSNRLQKDRENYTTSVNILSDPKYFSQYVDDINNTLLEIHRNRYALLSSSLKKFIEVEGKNKFLFNALFDIGLFLTPEGIIDMENGLLPNFYIVPPQIGSYNEHDVTTGIEELLPNSKDPKLRAKYEEALEIMRTYEVTSGTTLFGKSMAAGVAHIKNEEGSIIRRLNDNRTFKDLLEELGLETTDLNTTNKRQKLPIKDVIRILSQSLFLSPIEKDLLQALQVLTLNSTDTIEFITGLDKHIQYIEGSGIQVNLEAFGSDYGSSIPFERTLIRELMKIPTSNAYNTDLEFKASIDDMFTRALEWFNDKENKEKDAVLEKIGYQAMPYGLTSVAAFMAEAISNPRFQAMLQGIDSAKASKVNATIFTEFLDLIKKIIKAIADTLSNETLLDEAINVITERVFEQNKITSILKIPLGTSVEDILEAINEDTLNELAPKLYDKLSVIATKAGVTDVDAFIKENIDEDDIENSIYEYARLSEDAYEKATDKIYREKPKTEYTEYQLNYSLLELGYTVAHIDMMLLEDKISLVVNDVKKDGFLTKYNNSKDLLLSFGHTEDELNQMSHPALIELARVEELAYINDNAKFQPTLKQTETIAIIREELEKAHFEILPIDDTGTPIDEEESVAALEKSTVPVEDIETKKAEILNKKEERLSNIQPVYHHTSVAPEDFNFQNFQRGLAKQISQFGDGLNVSTNTTAFLKQRYGNAIQGEVNDTDFVVIDANKTEAELYRYLISLGYKINTPQFKDEKYSGKNAEEEYKDNELPASENYGIIQLFNDFQQSNPKVKGVKIINHVLGGTKIAPFYVIYDAKSFYKQGILKNKIDQETNAELAALDKQSQTEAKTTTTKVGVFKIEEDGTRTGPFGRISELKPKYTGPATDGTAAARGTHIDDVAKEFLKYDSAIMTKAQMLDRAKALLEDRIQNDLQAKEAFALLKFSDKFYDSLFETLSTLRDTANAEHIMLITDIPRMWGKVLGERTGEADILAIDEEGNVVIWDIKTASRSRRENYAKTGKKALDYEKNDHIQLNSYRELLRQRSGIKATIRILPMQVTIKDGTYTDVKLEKESLTLGDTINTLTIKVNTSKDIFEILGKTSDLKLEAERIAKEEEARLNEEIARRREEEAIKKQKRRDKTPKTRLKRGYKVGDDVFATFDKNKGFIFINSNGETATLNSRQRAKYADKLSKIPGMLRAYWPLLSYDRQQRIQAVISDYNDASELSKIGDMRVTKETYIMRALVGTSKKGQPRKRKNMKFSDPYNKLRGELTDVHIKTWISEDRNAQGIDTFATDIITLEVFNEEMGKSYDEAQLIELTIDVIKEHPKGITEMEVVQAEQEDMRPFEQEIADDFIKNFGFPIEMVRDYLMLKEIEDTIPDTDFEDPEEDEEDIEVVPGKKPITKRGLHDAILEVYYASNLAKIIDLDAAGILKAELDELRYIEHMDQVMESKGWDAVDRETSIEEETSTEETSPEEKIPVVLSVREKKDMIVDALKKGISITGFVEVVGDDVRNTTYKFTSDSGSFVYFFNKTGYIPTEEEKKQKAHLVLVDHYKDSKTGVIHKADVVQVFLGTRYIGNVQEKGMEELRDIRKKETQIPKDVKDLDIKAKIDDIDMKNIVNDDSDIQDDDDELNKLCPKKPKK